MYINLKARAFGLEIFHRYKNFERHINSDAVNSFQTAIKKIFVSLYSQIP